MSQKTQGVIERPKSSGKWYVRIKHLGKDQLYRVNSKAQGKVVYARLRGEILEGRYQPEKFKRLTLKTWIERCLEGSTNRDRQHEGQRARYWAGVLGTRLLSEITTEELRRHQAKMEASGEYRPSTINRYFSALRRVLTLAVNDGKIPRNPMKGVRFYPEEQQDRYFSEEELQKIRDLAGPGFWKEIKFAVETCLRASEQYELRWNQINFETRSLTIPLPKGNKTRRVPLSEEALKILRSLDSAFRSPWVFPGSTNALEHQNPYYAGKQFQRILRKAGIQGSWHVLRHTGATRRLLAGVDLFTVSQILGHRTIQTTMRYLHAVKDHMQTSINRGSLMDIDNGTIFRSKGGTKCVTNVLSAT